MSVFLCLRDFLPKEESHSLHKADQKVGRINMYLGCLTFGRTYVSNSRCPQCYLGPWCQLYWMFSFPCLTSLLFISDPWTSQTNYLHTNLVSGYASEKIQTKSKCKLNSHTYYSAKFSMNYANLINAIRKLDVKVIQDTYEGSINFLIWDSKTSICREGIWTVFGEWERVYKHRK